MITPANKTSRWLCFLVLILLTSCRTPPPHDHGPNGEHLPAPATPSSSASPSAAASPNEPEPLARTEFNDRLENFFEFEPLRPGQSSQFLIHLTDLKTGKPVEKADVTLRVKGPNGIEIAAIKARVGKVTGIYVADVKIGEAGKYGIDFSVKNKIIDEVLPLAGFEVSLAPTAGPEEAAPAGAAPVAFLMEQQWLVDMKLAPVVEKEFAKPIASTGRIVASANSKAIVSSPVPGKVSGGLLPRIGQEVSAEQALVVVTEVATASEQAQVRAAQAQVRAAEIQTSAQLRSQNAQLRNQNAQARIENARLAAEKKSLDGEVTVSAAKLDHARVEAARAREVYKIQVISQKDLKTVEEALAIANSEHAAVLAQSKALSTAVPVPQAALLDETPTGVAAGADYSNLTIVAPLSGVVTRIHKSLGEQVAAGEPILELSNLRTVWLETPVFEADLGQLQEGMEATFSVLSFPQRQFRGSLIDVGSVIDEKTRAATVVFKVDNASRQLRLGMQADVRLAGASRAQAMVIPKDAVLDRDGKKVVYVLLSGEEFQRRDVTVADDFGNQVAVTAGLNAGERVVSQGAYQLFLQETDPADAGVHSHET